MIRSQLSVRIFVATFVVALCTGGPRSALGQADDDASDSDDAVDDDAYDDDAYDDDAYEGDDEPRSDPNRVYAWRAVAGGYLDPTSSYALHGYVDAVYAGSSDDWTTPHPASPQAPGHLLVPNRNNSAFQYDAAIVLTSNLGSGRMMMELHLVSDPSGGGAAGPGGLTLAATELTAQVDIHPTLLTVSGGIYWAPFGIVNNDWLGAEAMFTTLPRATAAFPAHWNERGIRLNGARSLGAGYGVNYVVSVGNGVHSFDIGGQRSADLDGSKTVISRVGVFPGMGKQLEVGYSVAYGDLRTTADDAMDVLDARRYAAGLTAHGVDATLKLGDLLASAYYIRSTESLNRVNSGDPSTADLSRQGATAEVIYDVPFQQWFLSSVAPKLRVDWVDVGTLINGGVGSEQFASAGVSAGVNLYPHTQVLRFDEYPFRAMFLSLEYHVQRELDGPDLANDRFVARLTGRF